MTDTATEATTEQFADRLFNAALGTVEVMSIYLGDRLGWYRALADGGPATPAELVGRAGGSERYAREWLEQQASYGILTVDVPAGLGRVSVGDGMGLVVGVGFGARITLQGDQTAAMTS